MNGAVLISDFPNNICGCDFYIIHLLCVNYTSLHYSTLSTCIKAWYVFYKVRILTGMFIKLIPKLM